MTNNPGEANFFPDVPQFPSMGTFQPVYGKFDLTTYIQGASDYEIMAFLVGKYNACLEAYGNITKLSTDTITACKQLQDWINSWFTNLDVQEEINKKLDKMVADGSFGTMLHQAFDAQINQQTTNAVTQWLVANVTPTGSAVVVDKSLSIDGAAADALSVGKNIPFYSYNTITDCNNQAVISSRHQVAVDSFNAMVATPLNVPTGFDIGGNTWYLYSYYANGVIVQFLTNIITKTYTRSYVLDHWQNWDKYENTINIDFNAIDNVSVNSIHKNGIHTFNVRINPLDLPFSDWKDGSVWAIINFKFSSNPYYVEQVLLSIDNPFGKKQAYRQTNPDTSWQGWNIYEPNTNASNKIITCTPETTLRAACAEAIQTPNTTVIVKPGTYDLTTEFADHITAQNGSGIALTNGIKLIFEAGSYVKAEINPATEYSQHNFEPFYSAGDYEIIGLNISAKNTRYCVHDESVGTGTQHHIYRNCQMKYRNDATVPHYSQCIGGGMGEHTFIEIFGGIYDSAITNPSGSQSQTELDIPISYHNGYASTCDGKIFISGVYLANKGHFRFGYYGSSTHITPIEISNCSVGQQTLLTQETSGAPENFSLTQFNTELRI